MATGFFTGVQAPRRVGQRTRRGAFVFCRVGHGLVLFSCGAADVLLFAALAKLIMLFNSIYPALLVAGGFNYTSSRVLPRFPC